VKWTYLICGQIKSRVNGDVGEYFQSLRESLPGSKIIVSSWTGEVPNTMMKYVDGVVLTEDPGPCQWGTNFNRIVLASDKGIEACNTEYLIRSRVEIAISDKQKILQLMHDIEEVDEGDTGSNYIYFPKSEAQYHLQKGLVFCLADFLHAGKLSVIREYWPKFSNINRLKNHMHNSNFSISSDQLLCVSYAAKYFPVKSNNSRFMASFKNMKYFNAFLSTKTLFFDAKYYGFKLNRLDRSGAGQIKSIKAIKLSDMGQIYSLQISLLSKLIIKSFSFSEGVRLKISRKLSLPIRLLTECIDSLNATINKKNL
jgi:hypothetical protein